MKQLKLFKKLKNPPVTHKETKGKRKGARPLAMKRPIHLIIKSKYILLTHRHFIAEKIKEYSEKFGIKVFEKAIAPDHIHFAIQIPSREHYKKFIRALTGVIAKKMGKGMWILLPYTRIAEWGRAFRALIDYIIQNYEETYLLRPYKPRKGSKCKSYFTSAVPSPYATNVIW